MCRCEGVLSKNERIMRSTRCIHTLYIYIPTYVHTYSASCTYKEKSYEHTYIHMYTDRHKYYIPTYVHTYSASCTYKEKSYEHTYIHMYTDMNKCTHKGEVLYRCVMK